MNVHYRSQDTSSVSCQLSNKKMARHWMKFFLDAGIPKDSSAEYAINFESNRMEMDMLPELDKDYLRLDLRMSSIFY